MAVGTMEGDCGWLSIALGAWGAISTLISVILTAKNYNLKHGTVQPYAADNTLVVVEKAVFIRKMEVKCGFFAEPCGSIDPDKGYTCYRPSKTSVNHVNRHFPPGNHTLPSVFVNGRKGEAEIEVKLVSRKNRTYDIIFYPI